MPTDTSLRRAQIDGQYRNTERGLKKKESPV